MNNEHEHISECSKKIAAQLIACMSPDKADEFSVVAQTVSENGFVNANVIRELIIYVQGPPREERTKAIQLLGAFRATSAEESIGAMFAREFTTEVRQRLRADPSMRTENHLLLAKTLWALLLINYRAWISVANEVAEEFHDTWVAKSITAVASTLAETAQNKGNASGT